MKYQNTTVPAKSGEGLYKYSFGQQRLRNFGITMIVMGISLFLYYLGLFGGIDGPLNPSQLGTRLAAWSVSKVDILIISTGVTLLTLIWNWVYNLACFLLGTRRTCGHIDDSGNICGEKVKQEKRIHANDNKPDSRYVCAMGHTRSDARFYPLKKGSISHILWMISMIFLLVVFYFSYQ